SPGDVEAEFTISGATVETSRAVDARDFFYQRSGGPWCQPSVPQDSTNPGSYGSVTPTGVRDIGAFASDLISGTDWNSSLVTASGGYIQSVTENTQWAVLAEANLAGNHRDLWSSRWYWNGSAAVPRDNWDEGVGEYWHPAAAFNWRGYSVYPISQNDCASHHAQGYDDFAMHTTGALMCHGASLHSFGLMPLAAGAYSDVTRLMTPVSSGPSTIGDLRTYTFSAGQVVTFAGGNHAVRVLDPGGFADALVYSVHNRSPAYSLETDVHAGFTVVTVEQVVTHHQSLDGGGDWTDSTQATVYTRDN
ncbi:hypothetical protein JXA47_14045, partial [Candidatus Sumerlaeota bacterium]|nr:hypothetical protein [Candidatus Sumerlaeota bacterium]